MKFRNLEAVRYIIKEATGLEITYAYEDLVFPEHMAFLIQFNDANEKNLFCYFHNDCNPEDKNQLYKKLSDVALQDSITLENKGSFSLEQKSEEVEIHFQA
ncbi:hypothetical protein [Maribellus sediminis]|uniref:hypothetical protein n=1 Tax=Maribellus sediminis TaxID=2696285 RepID=UPI00142F786E|nr:hypothetical protein [Maribellus sediminis]